MLMRDLPELLPELGHGTCSLSPYVVDAATTDAGEVPLTWHLCAMMAWLCKARTIHSSSKTGDPDDPSLVSVLYSMLLPSGPGRPNVFWRNAIIISPPPGCWTML